MTQALCRFSSCCAATDEGVPETIAKVKAWDEEKLPVQPIEKPPIVVTPAPVKVEEKKEEIPVKEHKEVPKVTYDPWVLCIIAAKGMRSSDWVQGATATYCHLTCEASGEAESKPIARTLDVVNTLEPSFNYQKEISDIPRGSNLVFKLWDKVDGEPDDKLLGVATLPGTAWADGGFHGELRLTDAGDHVVAYIAVKIKFKGAEDFPPGPKQEFKVNFTKSKGKTLGMHLDVSDGFTSQVIRMGAGLVMDYNAHCKPDEMINVGDFICEVNGVTGGKKIFQTLREAEELTISFKRPLEYSVMISKPGSVKLGLNIEFIPDGVSLSVNRVGPGPVEEWNLRHPERAICPADRINAVNGFRGLASDLMKQLLQNESLHLMMCRPAPSATSYWWST